MSSRVGHVVLDTFCFEITPIYHLHCIIFRFDNFDSTIIIKLVHIVFSYIPFESFLAHLSIFYLH